MRHRGTAPATAAARVTSRCGGSSGNRRVVSLRPALIVALILSLAVACGGGGSSAQRPRHVPGATNSVGLRVGYAAELGGLDKLADAAKQERTLNIIGLPSDWANYAGVLERFQSRYGIAVVSRAPAASSRDEIAAAKSLRGTSRAPDVFDLSSSVAAANLTQLAPYKVTTWGDIPDALKEPNGRYVGGYGGTMSIGYDAKRVPAPRTLADLLNPAYRGKVAINGDPTRALAGFFAVVMAALANGGSAQEVGPGVDFFARLKQDGALSGANPTLSTITAGQTSVVLDWDYTNVQRAAALPGSVDWRVVVPRQAVVGSYYVQAINADAPHPATARLWEEFLFSDEGQNLWLESLVRPARAEAMRRSRALDAAAFAHLPAVPGRPVLLTPPQIAAAQRYLSAHWSKALG